MSMNALYRHTGMSKQGFHQWMDGELQQAEVRVLLRPLVEELRQEHPRMSAKVMYGMLRPQGLGRDRFVELCEQWGLLLERKRSPYRTTDSLGVTRFPNLLAGVEVTGVNQFWSSDITYYQLPDEVCYITLVMDVYSRRILGWQLSRSMRTEDTTLPALVQALRLRRGADLDKLVFHSDGGGQYYCKDFLRLTRKWGIRNSMCEQAWENPYSERINGTIKNDYLREWDPQTYAQLATLLDKAVHNYGTTRPHSSLQMMPPTVFEQRGLSTELTVINKEKRTKKERSHQQQHIELTLP